MVSVNTPQIYLDYAAATPLDSRALEAMTPYLLDTFYNPSSPYSPAVQVRRDYEEAKDAIAQVIGARGNEIIMTAGATESINLAFTAAGDGHVVTSAVEHHAVLAAASQYDVTYVGVSRHGRIDMTQLVDALGPETQLISIALANNEIGTLQPIRDVVEAAKVERIRRQATGETRPLYVHTDASQGLGLIDIHVSRLGVDLMTLNAGKVYGPKQVGLLWAASHVKLQPVVVGGGQERGLRSGTENVAGTIGFMTALVRAEKRRRSEAERLSVIRDEMKATLVDRFPEIAISGNPKFQLPNFLHVSFPGVDAERVLFALESKGVLVATGSACAANKGTRSHVLTAIGLAPEEADGSIRISLGRDSNQEMCQQAAAMIGDVVASEYRRMRGAR
ncbi:MAG TPA: cysteine desulfurase family protein [Candidatus Saccharibacteria bacterium]|nr:cysteine desulfurase family protein [Candidatus Saccharibacteria bacterium]